VFEKREQELDVRDYLTILGRRQWLIVLTAVTVIAATTFYTLTQTELYQAESRVLLRSPYMPYGEGTGGEMSLGVGLLAQTYDIETEIERIKNPELVKETRQRLPGRLQNVPINALIVHQIGKTAIIGINVESPNPQFAAQMSQELATAYIEHTRRMRQVATEQALKYVTDQAEHARADLDKADNAISAFKQASGIVDIASAGARVADRYESLINRIETGRSEVRVVDAQLAGLEARRKAVDPRKTAELTSSPDSTVGQIRTQLEQLIAQRLNLLRDYTETSHRVREVDAQIESTRGQLRSALSRATNAEFEQTNPELQALGKQRVDLEMTRLTALANIGAASSLLGAAAGELHALPLKQVRYAQLERQLKVAETAYNDLLAQAQVLRIQQAAAVASAFVLTRAEIPKDPVSPQVEKNMLTGTLVGLFLGLVVALVADRMDDTFRNPKELERLLRLPVLGLVRLKIEGSPVILTEEDERSPFAEAFRTLRANMRFSAVDGQAHTVLVTSAGAGEGKSTCAANLAIESARAGQTVILVDTDMRRPALHTYFGLEADKGLTNVLVGDVSLEEALQQTSVPGLRLLAAGALPPNPVVLIESEAMRNLVQRVCAQADLVVFDSPPVLIAADAQLLSSFADATLIVIETRATRREMAQRAMELLRRANAKPIGIAINKARQREQGYYYYYYYHYNYYYYNGYGKKQGNGKA
jgi:tyrosine-protein kinase Etk/Wzc